MNRIDSRAWLAWGIAASLPALLGRNPILIVELLFVVLVVRIVWASSGSFAGVRWFVRIAALFTVVGVVFNVLTVHVGTSVLAHLPERWPVIGGVLTLNALVYGLASGIALFTLVLIGTTAGSLVSWMDLFHAMPRRLAPIAIAGSVAWALLPQAAHAFQQIRESQEMRGHRARSVRGLLPLIVPLLGGALERALATSEALEARGFGASLLPGPRGGQPGRTVPLVTMCALGLLIAGAFSVLTGYARIGVVTIAIGTVLIAVVLRGPDSHRIRRTRYRLPRWMWSDTVVTGGAVVSFVSTLLARWFKPEALRFEPYPNLGLPMANAPLMIAIALLMVPALIAPAPVADDPPEYAP